jgi:hypothetical protein
MYSRNVNFILRARYAIGQYKYTNYKYGNFYKSPYYILILL